MHLARRLAGTGIAGAGCAQSQCLHHHTRPLTGSAASQPDTHPETPPSTLCALQLELHVTDLPIMHPLSTIVLMFRMVMTSCTFVHYTTSLDVIIWHLRVLQAQQHHQQEQQLDCLATHDLCIAWTDDTAAAHDKLHRSGGEQQRCQSRQSVSDLPKRT